ncbi:MAG TPA: YebC/PmpR family DNA-binding transcriptional regulator [Anaerolineaceae bacterium]|mgnify:FL=1|jgi:YebC/PmpR family DNA-binding regulatory protein|nr:YebC/PmpR family DNA-binding transcriptional regulator [Anaerolineales bacterium]HOG58217.1 YebC/PmpR family DNA-binding transcriptional regulator [Anaerolineaceae bacterium]HOR84725.1 YebC/PmpR family DNA-binding transcriptional regulator [Anaerolineaceae bacterium]HPL43097.1 YebC/PmpR family DNA-binding transcriptional regulator [Anaerolineaceae bacterium]HPY33564.1 YebC/PmpR family DNA-binding transcriptional regulator [Anaerolineaceae bacterium]
MSGHSHWSTIKRKKGAADAKKGAIFTRLAREITLAAREGGGDPSMNVSLYLAIDRARSSNMPKDSIERAIKRGTGEDKSAAELEELTYGGTLGHGIVALIQCVTENRNRTVAELRHILTRSGGNLADTSSISWQFDRKAIFTVKSDGKNFDKVFEAAVEGGADDVSEEDGYIEIIGSVESFKTIGDSLKKFHIQPEEAGLQMVAQQEMELDKEKTITVLRTIEALEESDDVQNVYSNLRITEEVLADLEKE